MHTDLLNHLPIAFERNVGQTDPEVEYVSRGSNTALYLGSREIYVRAGVHLSRRPKDETQAPALTTLQIGFSGASDLPKLEAMDLLPTVTNYYVGREPSRWHLNIENYGEVKYHDLYPGIDLLFHGQQGHLEYDFIVAPGVDPGVIKMNFEGAGRVHLSGGALSFRAAAGVLGFAAPMLYQERNGRRKYVRGGFVILHSNCVGFRVGQFDHSLPLVIDPVLTYGTFLTGSNDTEPSGVAADSAGEIYVAGTTGAIDFPVTNNILFGGSTDAFVSKISASGTTLIFSTYLGGSNFDSANGLAIDSNGNAYVVGNMASPNFPTTPNAFRTACPANIIGCSAPFVAKFGPTGTLIYSTLLSPGASARAIAVDTKGSAYISGDVQSNSLDVVNAFQPAYVGLVSTSTSDAFVQKLDPTGGSLVYSTYLAPVNGPNSIDLTMAVGIAVDTSGSAYVTGSTTSTNFPTKNNSRTLNAGHGIFVVKFKPDGSDLVYSASISGSNGTDKPNGIAVDPNGNAYIAGLAGTTDFPVSPNAFLAGCVPTGSFGCSGGDIFALEVSADASTLVYSTLLGQGFVGGIAVDQFGRAFIAGSTGQESFPLVNPIQASLQVTQNSNTDGFVTALDSSGMPFFSTFLGGAGTNDEPTAIAVDNLGGIYVTGFISGSSNQAGLVDFPLINPGEVFIPCCGVDAGFVSTIHLNASGPLLSASPFFTPIVVLRNVGDANLVISKIAGSANADVLGGNCGAAPTLTPGTECFLIVNSTTLTVTSNGAGSPQSFLVLQAPFSIPPPAQFLFSSANSVTFPEQLVGTSSQVQSFAITNIGTSASTINSINFVSGPFTQSNNCPGALPAGGSCTVQVTFHPTSGGSIGGDLAINHDGANQRIDIFAGGTGSTNGLAVSTPSIQFGQQFLGTTYMARTLVLTNVDVSPLSISGFSFNGPYSQTNNCPPALNPGANCRIFISFNPTANGDAPGSITITHSSVGVSQTVQLDGTGLILSDLSVSPLEITYPGNSLIGFTTSPVVLTLQNTSSQSISIGTAMVAPAVFVISANTCPTSLASGATCTISVTFTPTVAGPVTGSLTIAHGGVGNPQIVTVMGTGVTQLIFVPSPLDFGAEELNNVSSQRIIAIENNAGTPVTVKSLAASGDFQIAPGGLVTPFQLQGFFGTAIPLTFTPTALGNRNGTFTVTASDSAIPHQILLVGIGVGIGLSVAPGALNFNNVSVGTSSPAMTSTVTNTSATAVTFQSFSFAGGAAAAFTQTNNCGSSLAVGASCTIQISFVPTFIGAMTGTLIITDSADGSPQSIALQGTGTGPAVSLSQSNLNFNSQALQVTSPPQAVKVTNQMAIALAISSISTSGDFGQTNNCGNSLASGGSCNINVTFKPIAMGARNGTLSILDNGPGGQQTVMLTGIGTGAPSVTFSTKTVNFGGVLLNDEGASQNITISVTGAPLNIQGITLSSPQFRQQNSCPSGIPAGGNCFVNIFVKATSLGIVNATMQIQDDAPDSPQTVQLQATASDFVVQQASGSGQIITAGQTANFGGLLSSIPGVTETVTLTCSGAPLRSTCNLSQSSFSLTGTNQLFSVMVATTARPAGTQAVPVGDNLRNPIIGSPKVNLQPVAFLLLISIAFCALALAHRYFGIQVRHASRIRTIFLLAGVFTLMIGAVSCGGGGGSGTPPPPPQQGTPAGNYVIVITGTPSNSADPVQILQLNFTVQ